MELNGDGLIDILSGSYSRHDGDMAGLFQVLWGQKDGSFAAPEALKGTDGEPLIILTEDSEEALVDKICTRPIAVDLDGDGKLDIVSGNFGGTFAFFKGEGNGKFAPKSTWIESDTRKISVEHHSDPFLVDWDKDGDFDLLSGSAEGGAFLFVNEGTKTAPKFGVRTTLIAAPKQAAEEVIGDAHITGPQSSTRIWADDVNGDGKPDLLLGDSVSLVFPAKGVSDQEALAKIKEFGEKFSKAYESMGNSEEPPSEEAMKKMQAEIEVLTAEKAKFVTEESTGYVWLFLQK